MPRTSARGALRRSRAAVPDGRDGSALSSALRSDHRSPRPRWPGLLSGAARRTRPAGSLRRVAERARCHLPGLVARREGGVLAEWLQRDRPADGHQQLSDPREIQPISAEQHPADSRGVRAGEASSRRTVVDTRRDREDRSAGIRGSARVPGARARRGRQRTAAQRGLRGAPGWRSSSGECSRNSSPSRRC